MRISTLESAGTVKIGILGWGSLIKHPGGLPIADNEWHRGGPLLPIELSRLSRGREHLTYVIDPRHQRRLPTRYAISCATVLEHAIADLASREGCEATWIGFVETSEDAGHRSRTGFWKDIRQWALGMHLDAVIWTDLPPRFHNTFTLDAAVNFWRQLPPEIMRSARDYARDAPEEIDTDLRRRLRDEGLL